MSFVTKRAGMIHKRKQKVIIKVLKHNLATKDGDSEIDLLAGIDLRKQHDLHHNTTYVTNLIT